MKTLLLLIPLWIVREEIIQQDIKHPDIVFSQFLLETGHGTSRAFNKYNNCFGLTNRNGLMKFPRWELSIQAYKRYQQRYDCIGDYYSYLNRTWFAPNMDGYIWKIKSILSKITPYNGKERFVCSARRRNILQMPQKSYATTIMKNVNASKRKRNSKRKESICPRLRYSIGYGIRGLGYHSSADQTFPSTLVGVRYGIACSPMF